MNSIEMGLQVRWLTREVSASSSGIDAQWCKIGLVLVIIEGDGAQF